VRLRFRAQGINFECCSPRPSHSFRVDVCIVRLPASRSERAVMRVCERGPTNTSEASGQAALAFAEDGRKGSPREARSNISHLHPARLATGQANRGEYETQFYFWQPRSFKTTGLREMRYDVVVNDGLSLYNWIPVRANS
jgi:hypothetical protein